MKDSICSDFVFFNCTTAFSTAFPEAEVTVPWTSRKLVSWVVFLRCEKAGSLVKSTRMQTAESALVFVVPPFISIPDRVGMSHPRDLRPEAQPVFARRGTPSQRS